MSKRYKQLAGAFLFAVVVAVLSMWAPLYAVDQMLCDRLYLEPQPVNTDIKIIKIDEKTLEAYGPMPGWSRELWAQLVTLLNDDVQTRPAVLALDILFVGENGEAGDLALAKACEGYDNIVAAANLVFKARLENTADGGWYVDENHIADVEYPYEALREHCKSGFANALMDSDGYIRQALYDVETEQERLGSFASVIYETYAGHTGQEIRIPRLYGNRQFTFAYSGRNGAYEAVSLVDVLEGLVDLRTFKDSITLVGAYAPGMQDSYSVPIQRGSAMYGVEIQANIVEALLEGRTAAPVNPYLLAALLALAAGAYALVIGRLPMIASAALTAGLTVAELVAGKLLYDRGWSMHLLIFPVCIIVLYLRHLIWGYLREVRQRRKAIQALKKYVAPQVVEKIAKKGDFEIRLGGEKRNIAVLFVDIRGFTTMSEALEPEQVVGILNEYLSLTTEAIFKNGGTLDKFIGDAAMAVFNAPFDLEDYVYRAVCTARDIAEGSRRLEKRLMEQFGRTVSYGIGVHVGPAVVGNIGCEFRMDYTAIGDVVNTASRLEGKAGPGQILISADVYAAVKDRVSVTEVGLLPLKGKSQEIFIYALEELKP